MTDPYQILGVSRDATDDEIKKAYRDLARKYHPDNYIDNPLADLAQEKMKSINEAYDRINKEREGGGGTRSGGYSDARGSTDTGRRDGGYSSSPEFSAIRRLISERQYAQAESLLDTMANHSAEWNFLKGSLCFAKGWYDEARRYYQTACSMDPSNYEYRTALFRMQSMNTTFGRSVMREDECCDICSTLICLNCLCGGFRC